VDIQPKDLLVAKIAVSHTEKGKHRYFTSPKW
jgi:hypothetical protein